MTKSTLERRDVLKGTAAAGAMGLTAGAHAAGVPAYDPAARFDLVVSEVELRRNTAGRMLMARIYRPKGPGPFPTVLDLHGGAWNRKDRFAEEPMDRALAASGLLVVAVDLTIAPEAPYPACVLDANWSVRWLKANAGKWNGDGSKIGVYARRAAAMSPSFWRCGRTISATARSRWPPRPTSTPRVAWVAMRSPVSNTFARYQNAERRKNEGMIKNNKVFFSPWETIHESNPQEILERKEKVALPPLLIMQGALDDNVLPEMQEKFANTYRAAGGSCDYRAVRERRPRMGRRTRAADGQGARGGEGIHRAPAQGLMLGTRDSSS